MGLKKWDVLVLHPKSKQDEISVRANRRYLGPGEVGLLTQPFALREMWQFHLGENSFR